MMQTKAFVHRSDNTKDDSLTEKPRGARNSSESRPNETHEEQKHESAETLAAHLIITSDVINCFKVQLQGSLSATGHHTLSSFGPIKLQDNHRLCIKSCPHWLLKCQPLFAGNIAQGSKKYKNVTKSKVTF